MLGRFLSQGFAHFDLSRACVGQTRDPIPRVVVLGRLALYGEGAARLHAEVVVLAARWSDTDVRKEPLRPYAEAGTTTTLALLDASLLEARDEIVPVNGRERLLASVERDLADLTRTPTRTTAAHAAGRRVALASGKRRMNATATVSSARNALPALERWPDSPEKRYGLPP